MKGVLRLATLNQVEPARLRDWTHAAVQACGSLDLSEAFDEAVNHRWWEVMADMWPHAHPEKVLASALAKPDVDLDVVDWILVRAPRTCLGDMLEHHPDALPLTRARVEAECRAATAAAQSPLKRSNRIRV